MMTDPEVLKHNEEELTNGLQKGCVVWARLRKTHQFWPGIIVNYEDCSVDHPGPDHSWVFWFGDNRISKVEISNICDFEQNFDNYFNTSGNNAYKIGVEEAKTILHNRNGFKGFEEFKNVEDCKGGSERFVLTPREKEVPMPVVRYVNSIKKKNRDDVKENKDNQGHEMEISCVWGSDSDMFLSDCTSEDSESDETDSNNKVSLKEDQVKISEICICCQVVCKELCLQYSHPLFEGLCCVQCYNKVKDCMFDIGEDNVHIYCSVCATTGDMFICDDRKCCRVFCRDCIKQYWDKQKVSEIHCQNPWLCFLCTGENSSKYLKIRADWEKNVINLYKVIERPKMFLKQKRKLRVVSVTDGVSAILIALEELGIDLSSYCAFEENSKAMYLSLKHHGVKPYYTHLGKSSNFDFSKFNEKLGPVDLLVGGFYNDLPLKTEKQDTDIDENDLKSFSSFFEFYRLWVLITNKKKDDHPVLWLFVSCANIYSKSRNLISRFLNCEPLVLNTRKYSELCHPRLVWTNIPDLTSDWLSHVSDSAVKGHLDKPIVKDIQWICNIEKSFGFRKQYTNIGQMNILQRQELLGKSGNVIMIKKMLSPLCKLFAMKGKRRKNRKL